MSENKEFVGKVVLITGSSSGIGAVTAQEFSRAGAQVVITGRNAEKLSEVLEKCWKFSPKGLKPLEIVGDVSNEEDCKRLIESTINAFGRLDVLVNNAGFSLFNSIEDHNILEMFDSNIRTNLRSVIHLTHLSVKHLEKTKGNIVNISSMMGSKPTAYTGVYSTVKCGLDMFTKCSALELGLKGIRVNVVSPGLVRTNNLNAQGLDTKMAEQLYNFCERVYPLKRVGEPIDIANAILFLASEKCSWITGNNFIADGGGIQTISGTSLNIQGFKF